MLLQPLLHCYISRVGGCFRKRVSVCDRSMSYGVMPGMTMMMILCLNTLPYIFLIIVLYPPLLLHVTIAMILAHLWLRLFVCYHCYYLLCSGFLSSENPLASTRITSRYAQIEARGLERSVHCSFRDHVAFGVFFFGVWGFGAEAGFKNHGKQLWAASVPS